MVIQKLEGLHQFEKKLRFWLFLRDVNAASHPNFFPTSGSFGTNQCVWKLGKEGSEERWKGGLMTAVTADKNTNNLWREPEWLTPETPGDKG